MLTIIPQESGTFFEVNRFARFFRLCVVLLVTITICGCSASYKVIGHFDKFNEVFVGTVKANIIIGGGGVELRGENTGIVCKGIANSPYYIPPSLSCSGKRGYGTAECSDGRRVKFEWVATSCTTGHGDGTDSLGNIFYFTFGYSEKEAQKVVSEKKQITKNKPDLPAYRPKEVRKE